MNNLNLKTHLIFTLPIILLGSLFSTQIPCNINSYVESGDCINASPICALGNYHFDFEKDKNEIQEDLFLKDNALEETHSVWLKLEAEVEGDLEFVIAPDDLQDDIDFVIYVENENQICDLTHSVRVMTSGEIIGHNRPLCLGTTGLKSGSEDSFEAEGCRKYSDNFLKPLTLKKGKSYRLLVNNFDASNGFNISFSSSNGLKLKDSCNAEVAEPFIHVYPNPAEDFIHLALNLESNTSQSIIEVYNILGQFVLEQVFPSKGTSELNISSLSAGQYILRTSNSGQIVTTTFVKE